MKTETIEQPLALAPETRPSQCTACGCTKLDDDNPFQDCIIFDCGAECSLTRDGWTQWSKHECSRAFDSAVSRGAELEHALEKVILNQKAVELLCSAAGLPTSPPNQVAEKILSIQREAETLRARAEEARDYLHTLTHARFDTLLELIKFYVERKQEQISELIEPMPCDHYGANLQPDDSNNDYCVACYELATLRAERDALAERLEIVEGQRDTQHEQRLRVVEMYDALELEHTALAARLRAVTEAAQESLVPIAALVLETGTHKYLHTSLVWQLKKCDEMLRAALSPAPAREPAQSDKDFQEWREAKREWLLTNDTLDTERGEDEMSENNRVSMALTPTEKISIRLVLSVKPNTTEICNALVHAGKTILSVEEWILVSEYVAPYYNYIFERIMAHSAIHDYLLELERAAAPAGEGETK